jgi:hypothetical protein
MNALSPAVLSRIESLASAEHRNLEGQLMAMADLYERVHKIKSMQIKKTRGRPPKAKSTGTITQEKASKPVKGKPGRKPGFKLSEEARKRLSESCKGRCVSDVTKQKISYANKLAYAKKRLAKMMEK